MGVIGKPRDHMPVQMRDLVAKRSQIDFGWMQLLAQHPFRSEYHREKVCLFWLIEISHFLYVFIPDNTAKTGIIGIAHQNHATPFALPQDNLINRFTKRACQHGGLVSNLDGPDFRRDELGPLARLVGRGAVGECHTHTPASESLWLTEQA